MFNPLGKFDPNVPLNPGIVAKAQALYAQLASAPAGSIKRGYFHWTVAPMGACFADYNGEARFVNGNWILTITHDPRDNAIGVNDNTPAYHTISRNDGAIGVAITGMDGPDVDVHNFGDDAVTLTGLEHLCAAMAAFALRYDLDTLGNVSAPGGSHTLTADVVDAAHQSAIGRVVNTTGEKVLLTHAEAAQIDDYPADRWDLGSFVALPDGLELTPAMRTQCGDALRARTHAYKLALHA